MEHNKPTEERKSVFGDTFDQWARGNEETEERRVSMGTFGTAFELWAQGDGATAEGTDTSSDFPLIGKDKIQHKSEGDWHHHYNPNEHEDKEPSTFTGDSLELDNPAPTLPSSEGSGIDNNSSSVTNNADVPGDGGGDSRGNYVNNSAGISLFDLNLDSHTSTAVGEGTSEEQSANSLKTSPDIDETVTVGLSSKGSPSRRTSLSLTSAFNPGDSVSTSSNPHMPIKKNELLSSPNSNKKSSSRRRSTIDYGVSFAEIAAANTLKNSPASGDSHIPSVKTDTGGCSISEDNVGPTLASRRSIISSLFPSVGEESEGSAEKLTDTDDTGDDSLGYAEDMPNFDPMEREEQMGIVTGGANNSISSHLPNTDYNSSSVVGNIKAINISKEKSHTDEEEENPSEISVGTFQSPNTEKINDEHGRSNRKIRERGVTMKGSSRSPLHSNSKNNEKAQSKRESKMAKKRLEIQEYREAKFLAYREEERKRHLDGVKRADTARKKVAARTKVNLCIEGIAKIDKYFLSLLPSLQFIFHYSVATMYVP